jgi:hypothetical protein
MRSNAVKSEPTVRVRRNGVAVHAEVSKIEVIDQLSWKLRHPHCNVPRENERVKAMCEW